MEPNFKLPVKLTPESVLEDDRGSTIIPNFFYGTSDWINIRKCEKTAIFVEWWLNQWEILVKMPEVQKKLGIKEPIWENYWKMRNDAHTNTILKTKREMERELAQKVGK